MIRLRSIGIVFLAALPVLGQQSSAAMEKPAENSDILLAKIQADKKLLVSENMKLTESEAKGFWPVYDDYQKDLGAINKRLEETLKNFGNALNTGAVSDDAARKLMDQYLAIEQDEVNIKKTYMKKLSGVIPPAKIARYLQIETKIRSLIHWEMSKQIPLVQ